MPVKSKLGAEYRRFSLAIPVNGQRLTFDEFREELFRFAFKILSGRVFVEPSTQLSFLLYSFCLIETIEPNIKQKLNYFKPFQPNRNNIFHFFQ